MIEVILSEMIEEKKNKSDLCLIVSIELEYGKTITCFDVENYQCTLTGNPTESEDSEWIAIKSTQLNEINVVKTREIRRVHAYFSNRKHYIYE
jgi:hypothetical protein